MPFHLSVQIYMHFQALVSIRALTIWFQSSGLLAAGRGEPEAAPASAVPTAAGYAQHMWTGTAASRAGTVYPAKGRHA